MSINMEMVQKLRQTTGAGVLECKKALEESKGVIDEAIKILRTKGIAQAEKKSTRTTSQGLVASYVHLGGQLGVLVEINCETDFVARTDDFKALAHDIAMQVAAVNPLYVKRQDIPAEVLDKEREIAKAQVTGKPANVLEKIVEGKLEKYYEQFCLLDQPFIKDDKIKIADHLKNTIAKLGENITVRRFARIKLGE
ncbi:MAG: translation elongation factor Ts [bacterium]|nr:translation elongation factor Ts [bacterium]MDD5756881.1 translation elongation factor Ts [bacterium]